jgi:hypothetical protein
MGIRQCLLFGIALSSSALVSQAAAEKVALTCSGRTLTVAPLGAIEFQKTWDDEVLVFDLARYVVHHGDEDTAFATITETEITWKLGDGPGEEGRFSRMSLTGREQFQALGRTFINYYDHCKKTVSRF